MLKNILFFFTIWFSFISMANCGAQSSFDDTRCVSIKYASKDVTDGIDARILCQYDSEGRIICIKKEKYILDKINTVYSILIYYNDDEILVVDEFTKKTLRRITGNTTAGFIEEINGHVLKYTIVNETVYCGVQEDINKRPLRFSFHDKIVSIRYGTKTMDKSLMIGYPPNVDITYRNKKHELHILHDLYHKKDYSYVVLDERKQKYKKVYLNDDTSFDELTTKIFELSYGDKMGCPKFFNWDILRRIETEGDFDEVFFGMIIGPFDKAEHFSDFF